MKEARVECLTKNLLLPDLEKNMRLGDAFFISADKAKASKDLTQAVGAKAVSVTYVERFVLEKEPPRIQPPHVRRTRPNMGGMYKLAERFPTGKSGTTDMLSQEPENLVCEPEPFVELPPMKLAGSKEFTMEDTDLFEDETPVVVTPVAKPMAKPKAKPKKK